MAKIKKEHKKPKSTNPPFTKMERAFLKFKGEVCWKDVIPFMFKLIEENQPKDTSYNLDFFRPKKDA